MATTGQQITLSEIIANQPLASDVQRSVKSALANPLVHLAGSTVAEVIQNALDAAIRDIESHPNGELFQRFIEYGPYDSEQPAAPKSDGEATASDSECETCIEFIHSHMVNRFKGELAELLAANSCSLLLQQLKDKERLSQDTHLYLGDVIQERRRVQGSWGGFAKGADGLLVRHERTSREGTLELHGVIEVKSMYHSPKQLDEQFNKHVARLDGGVELGTIEWPPEKIDSRVETRISVLPSNWKLSRGFHFEDIDGVSRMVFAERSAPTVPTKTEEVSTNLWKITLSWSQEALEEAAYAMTFWYMAKVGRHVFSKSELPRSWSEMTPEDAGQNSIKMMLYYAMLRPLSDRHGRLAAKLYNVYCFGYPVGIDSREMLWPEDLK
jgi:hypothetical protein